MDEITKYIYNYAYHEEEKSLCALEMRAFFGKDSEANIIESSIKVEPSRSPFIRERIDVICEGNTLQAIIRQVREIELNNFTYKVVFVKNNNALENEKVRFKERRKIEREIGLNIPGEPDLHNPDIIFGILTVNESWFFGLYYKNKAIWLHHQNKPNSYSTALNTRVARAVVNIAVPNPDPSGIEVIDPCCGIGTVLVEGLSMGINIVGSDKNPLVLRGARENIAYFGLKGSVVKQDINDITESYDVAIIDLPYNLCSVITNEEQIKILESTRKFAKRAVLITIEDIDSIIRGAGFKIIDRCVIKKGKLNRQVIVCG